MKKILLSMMLAVVAMSGCADNSKKQADSSMEAVDNSQETVAVEADGIEAPDFTLNDLNGKPLTLSSLRGKYVILDFWGSWCGWCIKGIPQMKEYYQKYAGKFEILGIDGQTHVGNTQLSLDSTIMELYGTMNDTLWMYQHLYLTGIDAKEPLGLDNFKAFVHHRG